ncbi:MAG: PEP-CTERM sorting domain-containing protein [Nitrospirales bacterium]
MQWKLQRRNLGIALALLILLVSSPWPVAHAASIFINEIHYDNSGADTGEAIEIAGSAGTNLSGWSIVLYNGNGGGIYNTINLSGIIPDQQNGFGTHAFFETGIQNGSPDGLALVDTMSNVVQFLSYEGSFTALGGPANGLTSTDIGVSESSSTPLGYSLQLSGTGSISSEFSWVAARASTFGSINTGQVIPASTPQPMPEPSTILLLGSGVAGLSFWRRMKGRKLICS